MTNENQLERLGQIADMMIKTLHHIKNGANAHDVNRMTASLTRERNRLDERNMLLLKDFIQEASDFINKHAREIMAAL